MNDYFYLKITGVWASTQNRFNTLQFNLIYACRFIPKLIITLDPNYLILVMGQTL